MKKAGRLRRARRERLLERLAEHFASERLGEERTRAEILGGASVALGIYPALGALALAVFTLAASVLYHNFWAMQGEERASHLNSMASNLALVGAFLIIIAISW